MRTSERDLTYGELAAIIGGIAERLRADGRSGPVVGVAGDAVDVAVAILSAAATRRPAIIVPREAPEAAVAQIAQSAGATDAICPEGVTRVASLPVSTIGTTLGRLEPLDRSPDEVVAFVGTSGSTGAPRLVGLLEERFEAGTVEGSVLRGLRPGIRVATTFSTASAPIGTILRSLIEGATCSVLDVRKVPVARVTGLLDLHGVMRLRMVPSVLRSFVARDVGQTRLEQLEVLGAVGERLYWEDVARLRQLVTPKAIVTNAYGLTETGLLTERVIRADEPLGAGVVDVGNALDGRTLWIDAGDGTPAPPGVIGEIVVEGWLGASGVAMETLPDGRHRYRTGDLGSLRSDGSLMHHGRNDREVKIAGNRVDVGAVEAAFRSVPGVLDVAVLPADSGISSSPSDWHARRTLLVAHVHADRGLTVEGLRSALSERLTASAITPTIRLYGDALPKLPSGKLDVGALLSAG